LKDIDWKVQAIKLAKTEAISWRSISEVLGVARSTVSDYLRAYYKVVEETDETEGHDNSRILWISDLHSPFEHKSALTFLTELKVRYNPTRIIIGGDEADLQSLNMHGVNPDLPSAGEELRQVRTFMKKLSTLFPVADILESNHTSLAYRRAFKAGISKGYMKSYNEILEVPDTWLWHDDLMLKLPNGQDCYFCHGKSTDGLKLSRNMACNVVQGHYHSKFSLQFWSNPNNLFWSMQAGCLIDDKSLAMKYNKLTLERPIIGTGLIIDSVPILEAMPL
jgi:hypothetical protein